MAAHRSPGARDAVALADQRSAEFPDGFNSLVRSRKRSVHVNGVK
jgi:hypothetical protein